MCSLTQSVAKLPNIYIYIDCKVNLLKHADYHFIIQDLFMLTLCHEIFFSSLVELYTICFVPPTLMKVFITLKLTFKAISASRRHEMALR